MSKTFTVKQVVEAAWARNYFRQTSSTCSKEQIISDIEKYLDKQEEEYELYLKLKEKFETKKEEPELWYPDDSGQWVEVGELVEFQGILIPKELQYMSFDDLYNVYVERLHDDEREEERYINVGGKLIHIPPNQWKHIVAYKIV